MSGGSMAAKWVVVLAVAVMFSAGFLVIAADRLETAPGLVVDTTSRYGEVNCGAMFTALSVRGAGRFPGGEHGEIYDRTAGWYSWLQDGQSLPVIGEGVQTNCGGYGTSRPFALHARYVFDIKMSASGDWQRFHQDRIPNGYVHTEPNGGAFLGAFSVQIDGHSFCTVETSAGCPAGKETEIVDGSALRVTVYVLSPQETEKTWPAGWYAIGWDEVQLRNALPFIGWSQQGYRIGETATAEWEIPVVRYDTGNGSEAYAYYLSIIDCNTDLPLDDWDRTGLETETGQARIPVVESMFSNDLGTCQNRLRAVIYTQLIRIADADTSIQPTDAWLKKEGITIPVVTEISFDKADYYKRDTVTVTWKATGNVTKFHVKLQLNGLLLMDDDVDAATTSASAPAPATGLLVTEITAYSYCVPSDVKPASVWIGNAYPALCEMYPDIAECQPPGLDLWAWVVLALAVILLVIVVLVVAFVTHKVVPGSPAVTAVVALITLCVGVLGLLAWGVFDVALGVVR